MFKVRVVKVENPFETLDPAYFPKSSLNCFFGRLDGSGNKPEMLVLDPNNLANVGERKQSARRQKCFYKKAITVKKMAAYSRKTVLIAGFNLKNCFDESGENEPWLCKTKVTVVKNGAL